MRNEEIEKNFDFAQKIIKNVRSVRADYNLLNKTKTEMFFVCNDKALQHIVDDFASVIETLAFSVIVKSEPPSGCAIITITDKLQVHLLLKVKIIEN